MSDEFEHVVGPKRSDLPEYQVRVARLSAIKERIEEVQGHLRRAQQCLEEACLAEDPEEISMRWAALEAIRSNTSASRESCVLVLAGVREELERARAAVYEIQQTAD